MSRAQELLDAATPLPWRAGGLGEVASDDELIVYAVNALPAYEAAREALEGLVSVIDSLDPEVFYSLGMKRKSRVLVEARAALADLRDEVPA